MKLRSVIAAVAAVAVAATTTVTSFAASAFKGSTNMQSGMFACLLSDDPNVPLFTDYAPMSDFVGFNLTIKAVDKRAVESAVAEGSWIGGAFGFNSQSTGWKQMEWGLEGSSAADKPYIIKATDTRGVYTLSYTQDTPVFAATDTYAQVWIQNYADAYEFEIVDYSLLNSKGEDIRNASAEAPAETEKPAETTAPAEETPVEPTVEENEASAEEPSDEEVYTEEEVYTDEEVYTEDEVIPTEEDETDADADTAEAEVPAAGDDASANKGNPDTGGAGVAVAAGVVALAGAAVVVSRKRK